ncbi:PFAM Electron transfer flavoprotein alpha beta-subunit (plasmid) [Vibrio sp. B1REV9]|uniref:electron transfer flavoprotein subunit alpha/FixB family protein n=1 Tax=Vibrio sp. B1REV9 TaxID=2751179 RepID=UPI001AEC9FE8|nr:electron transfer flavoprotein subunit alpha/FixB family protein [Vibrio sp. B1REV9]CAE6957697.1 PFAM Electron transfer flavoprotein alpha beta-subunit [Vibrio sp. B1REV9]
MKILVVAEHLNNQLVSATCNAVGAAQKLASFKSDSTIDLLVAGYQCEDVAQQCRQISGINRVLQADAKHYVGLVAENIAELVVELVESERYDAVICASSTFGKNVSPRISALLDIAQVSDVISIESVGIYQRYIYTSNILLTLESKENIQILTVRTTAFEKAAMEGEAELVSIAAGADLGLVQFVKTELVESDRPELNTASVVVSGGRGLGSDQNYRTLLEPLADKLGAALGASRAAVDAGYVPNDYQVGQTGKIVAPELYIAVGISGAIQHLAGMSDSKVIVAINKDPDAPIFQFADYGLEGDLFTVVPELTECLAQS